MRVFGPAHFASSPRTATHRSTPFSRSPCQEARGSPCVAPVDIPAPTTTRTWPLAISARRSLTSSWDMLSSAEALNKEMLPDFPGRSADALDLEGLSSFPVGMTRFPAFALRHGRGWPRPPLGKGSSLAPVAPGGQGAAKRVYGAANASKRRRPPRKGRSIWCRSRHSLPELRLRQERVPRLDLIMRHGCSERRRRSGISGRRSGLSRHRRTISRLAEELMPRKERWVPRPARGGQSPARFSRPPSA